MYGSLHPKDGLAIFTGFNLYTHTKVDPEALINQQINNLLIEMNRKSVITIHIHLVSMWSMAITRANGNIRMRTK